MYRIIFDDDGRRAFNSLDKEFAKIPLTQEEQKMSRMTFDGLLLQSNLPDGEVMSIAEIAALMFTREGEPVGKIAMSRAKQAALNLISLGNAKAVPNRKDMTHVKSVASCGTQLAAIMSLSIRRSEQNRRETDKLVTRSDGELVQPAPATEPPLPFPIPVFRQ